ncbi:hypothetical protein [Siminovitchia fordii]|uniref:Uncharacterized protein n=1 Tax=Siminovitchia fordii TaxID=254759 RepID=A0ABQ4K6S4_9BACI|nr:hypothetical protein [Siminovitchia fordii]GIN21430.1 hypothetical protein J1TS3_25640 [Siminovitchia fordii]
MATHLTPEEAKAIRKRWEENGKPECKHTHIAREYMYGAHSDYVCTSCGEMQFYREAFNNTD